MAEPDQRAGRAHVLTGRTPECHVLDGAVERVRSGRSAVLVVRGEPGVGKTALLDRVADASAGAEVVRVSGVESEADLPYATVHQLVAWLPGRLDRLPDPQRDALATVFGVRAGPEPDRLLVGLAVLNLVTAAAGGGRPLVCLVDDVQWLDRASAQVLAFVARRLSEGAVLLVLATREQAAELAGLPELVVRGLGEADARQLLGPVLRGPLDDRVRRRILAEARGNPRDLLALARSHSPRATAGGLGPPDVGPVSGAVERDVRRRLAALPAPARRLLQLAAADPTGDQALLWRAAGLLGIPAEAAAMATDEGLVELGSGVRFRRPPVRALAYRSASPHDRRRAHRALSEATDPRTDPDLVAWHLAAATLGPDEDVAAALERRADLAGSRGGLAAAAAFLERAANLTPEPGRRRGRAVAAAETMARAGAFDVAQELLSLAEPTAGDPLLRARADVVRAELAVAGGRAGDATALRLGAARHLGRLDAGRARTTYLDAFGAAVLAGHLVAPGGRVPAVARIARRAQATAPGPGALHLLLDGAAACHRRRPGAGLPMLRRALAALGRRRPDAEEIHWLGPASVGALYLWDDVRWDTLSSRHVDVARRSGALGGLPFALSSRIFLLLLTGDLAAAAELVEEARATVEATGGRLVPYGALGLAALRGDDDAAAGLVQTTRRDAAARGEGTGLSSADWADAVRCNGSGRYDEALAAATQGVRHLDGGSLASWCLAEQIEAAVRTGTRATASRALRRLAATTRASGTDWALGVEARSRAVLQRGAAAERLFQEAVRRLARTPPRWELARAQLLYGEWLRREHRRSDGRRWLRAAHDLFAAMGAEGFAERARRELLATGATVRRRAVATPGELTSQEARIAWFAHDGLTNPEISMRLFISHRTVEYHLAKVYSKLGITSRGQLATVLPTIARRVSA